MSHGFRLFTFKLVAGTSGSAPLDFATALADQHAADHLVATGKSLIDLGTLSRMPALRRSAGEDWDAIELHHVPDAELTVGDPKVRWLEADGDTTKVSMTFKYGVVSRHQFAMASTGADVDIKGKAPLQDLRADFFFPKSGRVGILALESIDRVNAVKVLHHWLARAAIQRRGQTNDVVHKFSFSPLPDYARLKQMIEGSDKSVIRLKKYEITGSGVNTSRRVKLDLESKVTTDDEAESVLEWATGLYEDAAEKFRKRAKEKPRRSKIVAAPEPPIESATEAEQTADETLPVPTKAKAVAELEEIVGNSVSGVGFDDGIVVLRDENGIATKVGPHKLDDVFIYPITNELVPDPVVWTRAVESQIMGMTKALEIEIQLT